MRTAGAFPSPVGSRTVDPRRSHRSRNGCRTFPERHALATRPRPFPRWCSPKRPSQARSASAAPPGPGNTKPPANTGDDPVAASTALSRLANSPPVPPSAVASVAPARRSFADDHILQFLVLLAKDPLVEPGNDRARVSAILALHSSPDVPSATIRRVIVASCTVIPTSGSRPRAVMSPSSSSQADSPNPKQFTRARRITRPPAPAATNRGRTQSANIGFISLGTPGRATTRQGGTPFPLQFEGDAGSGAARVGDDRRSPRKHRLDFVPLGHLPLPPREHRTDVFERRFIQEQIHSSGASQRLARQIVERRPQPPRQQHEIGPLGRDPNHLDVGFQIVGDGGV